MLYKLSTEKSIQKDNNKTNFAEGYCYITTESCFNTDHCARKTDIRTFFGGGEMWTF